MFWCCMSSYFAFYCAHWQTYVSGKLKFAKYVLYFVEKGNKTIKFTSLDLIVPKLNLHLSLFIVYLL